MFSVTAPVFAQALTLTVADSSDVRARLDTQTEQQNTVHWDATTSPSATLALDAKRTAYSLSYVPAFSVFDAGTDNQSTTIFHSVNASATVNFKRTSVYLGQTFTYGTTNYRLAFSPTSPTPGPPEPPEPGEEPGEPVGPDTILPGQEGTRDEELTTGSSNTTLGLRHDLTQRLTFSEFVGYSYSTGFGRSADTYPTQQGGSAGLALGVEVTEHDSLSTSLTGSLFYTDPIVDPDDPTATGDVRRSIVARLQESWTRTWGEDLDVTLGTGISYYRTEEGDLLWEGLLVDIGPVGVVSITYKFGYGGALYSATGSVGSTPYVDRYTGIVDPRIFWAATLERVKRRLTLQASVSGAQSTDPESVTPLSTVTGELVATYEPVERFQVRAGASASSRVELSDEALTGEERPPAPLYYAFVGFVYTFEQVRF